ncbi:MAG TPA: hypothetical protein VMB22_00155 [Verrucomicrobiae bacterium]|nr:hypothetical protein [Verrucomicrobiae bacterium]
MNRFVHQFILRGGIFAALFAGAFACPSARAQQVVNSRYLFIFETSPDMKRCVSAAQTVLDGLFFTGMNEQLQTGDSIGVWAFGKNLSAGQFPLQYWVPDRAEQICAGLKMFVEKQSYFGTARFSTVTPLLNQVVQGSKRLTVLIFCDGETTISGTPYDTGVNQILRQRQAAQKKARQPIIVVLRAQNGKYTGCMVDFPPGQVGFPTFPPLPPPPSANLPPPTTSPPPLPPVMPTLYIVGTNPPSYSPSSPTEPANGLPPVVPMKQTNVEAKPPLPTIEVPTLTVVGTNPATNPPPPEPKLTNAPPVTSMNRTNTETNIPPSAPALTNVLLPSVPTNQTNALAPPPENSGLGSGGILAIGAGCLVVAAGVGIFIWRRSRKSDSSLITRSMNRE